MANAQKAKAQLLVELALAHFTEEVQSVVLRFSKLAPNHGPAIQRCQMIIDLKPRRIRVEHADADLTVALKRAADKAARSIARVLDEQRPQARRPSQ